MLELNKFIIRVYDEELLTPKWTHLCYIDKTLYNKFLADKECTTAELPEFLSRWAKEDFSVELPMTCRNDIRVLKHLVKDFYKRAHPYLYIDSETDRQGWIRTWVTKKMREELNIYGEQSI